MKLLFFLFISFSQSYIQVDLHNQLLAYTNKHILKAVLYKYLIGKKQSFFGDWMNPNGSQFNFVFVQMTINHLDIGEIKIGNKNFLEIQLNKLLLNIHNLQLENFTGKNILLGFVQRFVNVSANNLLVENVRVFCFMKPNSEIPQVRCQVNSINFDNIVANAKNIYVNGLPLSGPMIDFFLPIFLTNSKKMSTTQQISDITNNIINGIISKLYKKHITFHIQKTGTEGNKIPLNVSLLNIKSPVMGGDKNKRIRIFIEGMQSKGVMNNDENHPCFTILVKKKFFEALSEKIVKRILNANQKNYQQNLNIQNFQSFLHQLIQSSTSSTKISNEKSKAFLVAYIDKS